MIEDKDIKIQIKEYHKLLEDIRAENISERNLGFIDSQIYC